MITQQSCRPELEQRIVDPLTFQIKFIGSQVGQKPFVQHRFQYWYFIHTRFRTEYWPVFHTRLHGNITGIVPFVATMDFTLNSYVDWASGLLIYAQFKGF